MSTSSNIRTRTRQLSCGASFYRRLTDAIPLDSHVSYSQGDALRSDADTPIQHLKERTAEFARERQWEQFHSPKNLSMAMAVEAAEVMELFQWKTEQETQDLRADPRLFRRVRDEIADVAVYLLNLCNRLDIDL